MNTERFSIMVAMLLVLAAIAPQPIMGATTTYGYDELNRLTSVHYADCSNVTYIYDAAGNTTTIATAINNTMGDFDGNGSVDIADAIGALLIMVERPSGQSINTCSEVNADGRIGIAEVLYIMGSVADLK